MPAQWFRRLAASSPEIILEQAVDLDGGERRVLESNRDYIRVRLNTLKLAHGRKGTQKYYGCVYSEFRVTDERLGEAVYHTVTMPNYLKSIDEAGLDRVLVKDITLLEAVPYRGDLGFEIGLVSVPTTNGDLVAPYLEFLTEVADKTGVGALAKTALGYVQPLQKGFDLLCGAQKGIRLEVGVDKGLPSVSTGSHVLCRGDLRSRMPLKMDDQGALIDTNGAIVEDLPYVIYSIETTKRNSRWKSHEVKEAHDALMNLYRRGETKQIREQALPHFKAVVLASPELILEDAIALGEEEERRFRLSLGDRQNVGQREVEVWSLDTVEDAVDAKRASSPDHS